MFKFLKNKFKKAKIQEEIDWSTFETNEIIPHEDIAKTACCLWEAEGRPQGKDEEFWLSAEKILKITNYIIERNNV